MDVQEDFSDEARIQLNFVSFMAVAVWICFGVSITFAVSFHLFVTTITVEAGAESTMFWVSSALYGLLGFGSALVGSAIIYPIYNFWCERMRGQRVRGKFALIKRGL